MNARLRCLLIIVAAFVMALSYLGGVLAPPLNGTAAAHAGAAMPAAPQVITLPQWQGLYSAILLLLGETDYTIYLPMIRR